MMMTVILLDVGSVSAYAARRPQDEQLWFGNHEMLAMALQAFYSVDRSVFMWPL